MSYQLVEQLHKKAIAVERLCRLLSVSCSVFYGWRQRVRSVSVAWLAILQLKAEFAASGRVYGSRRLNSSSGLRRR